VTGWWFSSGAPVSSTNKTDRHDITEILLKVPFNTINQPTFIQHTKYFAYWKLIQNREFFELGIFVLSMVRYC